MDVGVSQHARQRVEAVGIRAAGMHRQPEWPCPEGCSSLLEAMLGAWALQEAALIESLDERPHLFGVRRYAAQLQRRRDRLDRPLAVKQHQHLGGAIGQGDRL